MPKKRSPNAAIGNRGVDALRTYCTENDLIFQGEPREDFGIDCYIEVEVDTAPTNFLFAVQVKTGRSYRTRESEQGFSVRLRPDDVEYWLSANIPVIFVYYHEHERNLFFKHVQHTFDEARALEACLRLDFKKDDAVLGTHLADYVRSLARGAPNALHRMEVAGGDVSIRAGDANVAINTAPLPDRLSFAPLRNIDNSCHPECLPDANTVIGYSTDGEWVCEAEYRDHGEADGFAVAYRFHNIVDNEQFTIPLVESKDAETSPFREQSFNFEQYNRSIDHLERVARYLEIVHPVPVYVLRESTNGESVPPAVVFGTRPFFVTVGQQRHVDLLTLTDSSFSPPRRAALLLERREPAWMPAPLTGEPVDYWTSMEDARGFEMVEAIYCSPKADLLSFEIRTNLDHACWGSATTHIAHFTIDELRRACWLALA